ncbi:uncharacterized protein LOC108144702 [Drosophila elegans]|uniref:uncharacterized protein LOC108144702 n=1 Tax=Drosophila elegans TaxID=30023 RepID=UPI0007E65F78|nr:uncharacterized protein LOC108144702 [Drosophila elegans]
MPNSAKKSDSSRSNSSTPRRPRKRRRGERHSLDSQVDEDVKEIDRRLRKVAKDNSISTEDMQKVVRKVVRNDHVLALVTLKAEDELAREKLESAEQQKRGAIIITDTPSVPKLTRAKARELNCTPGISLPQLNETPVDNDGIEALIREDLHSDEEDEEYTFKEEDFHSDDDPNTTASDFDSNPCTPQTPLTANEESPVKFSDDGCFKVPFEKGLLDKDDLRISTRTRSKFCLQQTTIEDLQSEFVPPDVEPSDVVENDMTATDADWMQFLNDFTKPLSNTVLGDDDDPINDPEYDAADHLESEYENAEELRDVNISKKELTDLVSELFAGLLQEGVSLESIELETPQKFMESANVSMAPIDQVTRNIDFEGQVMVNDHQQELQVFQPSVIPPPCDGNHMSMVMPVPVAVMQEGNLESGPGGSPCKVVNIPTDALSEPPELIAVPIPGQPNCFQLAKVVANDSSYINPPLTEETLHNYSILEAVHPPIVTNSNEDRYKKPFDTNFTWEYISVKKHIYSEYEDQFENLRNVQPANINHLARSRGFTKSQHDMLQQQLRIHTQMLSQSYLQTYSHPTLYPMAQKPREMLEELHKKAIKDASFNCWNLNEAIQLVRKWEHDLCSDEFKEENEKMMEFINKETELTDGHTRQVPRLAPRIMDLMLDSQVFMYPQYLPRMAFQPKLTQVTAYAPSEYQLIAIGLEKHMEVIGKAKRSLRKGADPIRVACRRMAKDTIHGKTARRIFMKITELRNSKQYNPVKYFLDRQRAPPTNHILWGFEGGLVRTPRERHQELPSGWQYYIEKTWDQKRTRRHFKPSKASSEASASYLEFVREAVGEDLVLPESFGQAAVPNGSAAGSEPPKDCKARKKPAQRKPRPAENHSLLTINVNYVFGGDANAGNYLPPGGVSGVSVPLVSGGSLADNVLNINRSLYTSAECSGLLALPPAPPPLAEDAPPAINFRVDESTHTLQICELEDSREAVQPDLLPAPDSSASSFAGRNAKRARYQIFKPTNKSSRRGSTPGRSRYHKLRERLRHKLSKRCHSLITTYGSYLRGRRDKYIACELVQLVHIRFVALELYTQLLDDLKMFCSTTTATTKSATATQPKRSRSDDEAAKLKRANRQEEMLRHMLQPDSPEERNRKDAIFALNFYDKVEEALLNADRLDDCRKFNSLLQNYDPRQEKVSSLYLKVEKILLPDHPELAEVFLNFLLPAEAAEIGKFFEHFMITNATNFINKLNIYFNKQPAQIRKIYACLSELAELPNVSMKKVENKIMPLLKGNQFLADWFVQQFPQGKPPKRILSPVETINLHDVQNNTSGEYTETIQEFLDVPTTSKPGCHLKYINGRIFYGAKILLPAKLSFMAASIYNEQTHEMPMTSDESLTCAHGIRAQGEKLLSMAANTDSDDAADRSEEDDASRALVIDTTGDEQNSCSSIEMCDEAGLRAHAIRLNASLYTNSSFSNAATSTPNVGNSHGHHHPHAKKTAINFGEISPRRQSAFNNSGLSPLSGTINSSPHVDKRKSPTKKVRSPLNPTQGRQRTNNQPMVVIHESQPSSSPAIECAKRLRTLIDQESVRDAADTKAGIRIIAQAKQQASTPTISCSSVPVVAKIEVDSLEETAENPPAFMPLKMDLDQSEEELEPLQVSAGNTPQHIITTQFDSDEDCKLDVVATLANCSPTEDAAATASGSTASTSQSESSSSHSAPWTREEDKVILIEMKMGARDREQLIRRICAKLKHRSIGELRGRHQFLMDFLSKLQGK